MPWINGITFTHIKQCIVFIVVYNYNFSSKINTDKFKNFGKLGKSTKTNTQQFKNYNNEAMSSSLVNNQNWNNSIRKTNEPVMYYKSK